MRDLALIGLAAVLFSAGCQKPEAPTPPQPTPAPPAAATAPTTVGLPAPPPQRHALPLALLDMRLRDPQTAGRLVSTEHPEGLALQAVGLNLCQTGYVLQALFRDPKGELRATPPLPLPVLREAPYVHRDPEVPEQRIETNFEEASMSRLRGVVRVIDDETDDALLELQIDTVPVGVPSGPGLGALGCFTTGQWSIEEGGRELEGPVSAVWDNKVTYWVGLRLDAEHTIDFWVTIAPQHRRPGRVLRGDLERVGAQPRKFPFRVVFRTRNADGTVTEIPAQSGQLMAAFTRDHAEGPLRVEMKNLKMPEWKGPFSGQTLDTVRAETLVVTDLKGSRVPIPGTVAPAQK